MKRQKRQNPLLAMGNDSIVFFSLEKPVYSCTFYCRRPNKITVILKHCFSACIDPSIFYRKDLWKFINTSIVNLLKLSFLCKKSTDFWSLATCTLFCSVKSLFSFMYTKQAQIHVNRCEEGLWGHYLAQVGPSNLAELRDFLLPATTGKTKEPTWKWRGNRGEWIV